MNVFEIICMISGIVGLFYNPSLNVQGTVSVICHNIYKIIMKLAFALMILLPLYFNYWR
jgi:hypothetical protein